MNQEYQENKKMSLKKMSLRTRVIWGLALLPLVIIGVFYNQLPELVPLHWSVDGDVRYGSRLGLWTKFDVLTYKTQ
jgi:uncharacterized membrane protein